MNRSSVNLLSPQRILNNPSTCSSQQKSLSNTYKGGLWLYNSSNHRQQHQQQQVIQQKEKNGNKQTTIRHTTRSTRRIRRASRGVLSELPRHQNLQQSRLKPKHDNNIPYLVITYSSYIEQYT